MALVAAFLVAAHTPARAQEPTDPIAPGPASVQTQTAVLVPETLDVGGVERSFLVHVPAEPEGAPLVLVLHGRGGRPDGTAQLTRFHDVASGAVVAYPAGLEQEYNYARGIPGYPDEPDDTAFLLALVDRLVARYALDADRVYAVGFSNGGFMSQRLACDAPERFAGIASVAAAGFGAMELVCPSERPSAGDARPRVLLVHGTFDGVVPWDGMQAQGVAGPVLLLWPVPETFAYWAYRNGCSGAAERSEAPEDPATRTRAVRLSMNACTGAPVELVAVSGGGHTWPGGGADLPASLGAVAPFSASTVIWEFFGGVAGR